MPWHAQKLTKQLTNIAVWGSQANEPFNGILELLDKISIFNTSLKTIAK